MPMSEPFFMLTEQFFVPMSEHVCRADVPLQRSCLHLQTNQDFYFADEHKDENVARLYHSKHL